MSLLATWLLEATMMLGMDAKAHAGSRAPFRAGAGAHEFGASRYPDEPNITLDGTTSDSLYFGPLAPTAGAGDFDAGKS